MTAVSRLFRAVGGILAGLVRRLDRPGQAEVGVSGRRVAAQNYVARPWLDARQTDRTVKASWHMLMACRTMTATPSYAALGTRAARIPDQRRAGVPQRTGNSRDER
jgi:hypothetical protein